MIRQTSSIHFFKYSVTFSGISIALKYSTIAYRKVNLQHGALDVHMSSHIAICGSLGIGSGSLSMVSGVASVGDLWCEHIKQGGNHVSCLREIWAVLVLSGGGTSRQASSSSGSDQRERNKRSTMATITTTSNSLRSRRGSALVWFALSPPRQH